ncbi:ECF RNA polymerase sigma factor SigL [Posidoniimonas corsicana]|uniref:ECF RNA polymerase sigma factor SigL n=1 Tax=Posidoniimonas corsicana TaxID=1938618 RepID=A0A5C5V406_9BACT|nr:sigma-70 family RNA polymerase sigma factor [Posidoniimonas corsicana]TWT32482.1 ECF RNA polymerase sigma factor SigL [Posidoniimonas corsicana]
MPSSRNQPDATTPPATGQAVDWQAALAEHGPWLRTVVLARLGEAAAVPDVMQQVALAAAKRGGELRDPARVAPWLYRVAVTESLLHRRRQGRRRGLLKRFQRDVLHGENDPHQPDPLDWLLAAEQQALVRRALALLPRRDAEILLLKHTQDWTYRQLAEHLGVSEAAVDGRLQRARGRLRRALVTADPTLAH